MVRTRHRWKQDGFHSIDSYRRSSSSSVMRISLKTELKLNNYQRTQLAKHAGVARHAWNWGLNLCKMILDHNLDRPEEKLKFPSAIDLHKLLVKWVKSEHDWYYEVSKTSPQYALKYLSAAFTDFFKKKTIRGKPVGFPRFKRKGQQDSFTLEGTIKIDHRKIQLPKIGILKTYEYLPIGLTPKTAIIGSINRHKANQKLAKKHAKIANIRKVPLHKSTTHLAKNHGQVVIEDLNVSGMMANHKLAKSIADLGVYEFRRQLTYKCELYGSKLITVNRFYPSSKTCSCCGHIPEMPLKERVFNCLSCSTSIERDLNAALNLEHQAFILA
jgi:putative transposase